MIYEAHTIILSDSELQSDYLIVRFSAVFFLLHTNTDVSESSSTPHSLLDVMVLICFTPEPKV